MTGITRAIVTPQGFSRQVYFWVPSSLSGGASVYTVKNPTAAPQQPCDVRLRDGGTIDIHVQDDSIPDTAGIEWKAYKGKFARADMQYQWDPDTLLSRCWVYFYFDLFFEDVLPTTQLYAEFTADEPTTLASANLSFELERGWWSLAFPPPYDYAPGIPPEGDLTPGTSLETGGETQTTMELAGFTGLALITDSIGLNRSASQSMTSVTSYTAAPHSATGHSRWSVTGLSADTTYYWQMTNGGTPYGPVIPGKTLVNVGTTTTLRLAIGGCKQNPDSSTAVATDIATWTGFDRTYNLGDNGYPSNLDDTPETHAANWAKNSCDPGRMEIAALGTINNTISDHDTNGAHGISNQPNYHDPVTAESILVWPLCNPVRMDDTRNPKRDRGVITYEGNFVIMQPDTRSWDKTDNRATAGIAPDSPSQTMLGATQLARFLAAITAAANAHRFIVWLTDPAWNGRARVDSDTNKILLSECDKWPGYIYERDLISDHAKTAFTAAGSALNMIIGHSDSHALLFDDGTNSWSDKNGMWVFGAGQICQNAHSAFGPDSPEEPPGSGIRPSQGYEEMFPANAGQAGTLPTHMMYTRLTLDNSSAATVSVTVESRDCTPKHGAASTKIGPYNKVFTL